MTAAAGAPVVVTGLGALTPLGPDVAALEEGLLSGRSGVRLLDEPEFADLPARLAATVDLDGRLERVEARTLDRVQQVALVAAREAWADAGAPEVEPERLAVVIGSGIGGALTLLGQNDVLREKGPRRVSPHLVPMLMPNGPAATVGLELGARAGVHTPGQRLRVRRRGDRAARSTCCAPAAPTSSSPVAPRRACTRCRWPASRRCARCRRGTTTPAAASRPYDKGRDGFVLGEGAGVLVLETEEHAAARGARVHARLAGAGLASDAHHVTAPDPAGDRRCPQHRAAPCATPASRAADVGHVNAHATSTPLGDLAEARALNLALGSHRPPVTAPKSCTGHLLGAAGAVEAIAAVLALQERRRPGDPQPRRPGRRGRRRRRAHRQPRARARRRAAARPSASAGTTSRSS